METKQTPNTARRERKSNVTKNREGTRKEKEPKEEGKEKNEKYNGEGCSGGRGETPYVTCVVVQAGRVGVSYAASEGHAPFDLGERTCSVANNHLTARYLSDAL